MGSKATTVFIDEIQLHPALLGTLQVLLDSKEFKGRLKFFLTGSSARKLRRGHANLLPGRIFSFELGAICAAELAYKLNVRQALKYGSLPEAITHSNDAYKEKLLTTYAGIYLKEEIQAEALTRNLDGYSRFLIAAAESSGHILDFSKIAKQAKIERKLCSRFYEILEDTLLAHRLEVYDKTGADIKKRPKYYFFDTGVLNGLLENFTISNERKGFLFEHLVINQIVNSAKARDLSFQIHYFRTRAGYEVDLILEIRNHLYAIEIKSGSVGSKEVNSLLKIRDYLKKPARFYIVGLENVSRTIQGVRICELNQFLKEIGL